MKKFFAILLSAMLMLSLAVPAFAQTVGTESEGTGSITISNASKGETYKVVKLFDASVTGAVDGSIVYTGVIPDALDTYFEKDGNYVIATEAAKDSTGALSADAVTAIATWAETQAAALSTVSDGSELTFAGLAYGYYVVISSQGAVISVDSTNPNATIVDKNTTNVSVTKSVNDSDVDIGQTVTYTLTASTANYLYNETTKKYEIVTKYVINDTLPNYLTDVTVTGIIIDQPDGADVPLTVEQFGDDKQIEIPWAENNNENLYENGSQIVITYTAKVTNTAVIDGEGNKNVVTLTAYTTPDDTTTPDAWEETWHDNEIIFTYAAALQKVDQNKKPLAGAKFYAKGLTVEKVSDGVYRVTTYEPTGTEYGTEMETDAQGQLVILGLSSESKLTVKETEAPAGYNLLTDTFEMTPVKTGEVITATEQTIYYGADGKVTDQETETSHKKTTYNLDLLKTAIVIVNQAGTELPETGGMGTTIFYIVGGVMVAAAVVLLITKKRMSTES